MPRLLTYLTILTVMLITSCQSIETLPETEPRSIETIADDYVEALLNRYPSIATSYGLQGRRHDRLFDNSLSALSNWQAKENAFLEELHGQAPVFTVGSRDWVTYGFLIETLNASQATRICRKELWETSTATAWHTGLPFIFDVQPLATTADREDALMRLGAVAGYIDTEISNLTLGLAKGYSSPQLTVVEVPAQVRALLNPDNPFLNMGRRSGDTGFEVAVKTIYEQSIQPALLRFIDYIKTQYLPNARTEIAISHNPDGAQCYTAVIRAFSSLPATPSEIHAAGLVQMASIRAEMRTVIDTYFNGEATETFLRRINQDPAFTFVNEQAVLEFSIQALVQARARMNEVFDLLPKASVLIKPYPDFAASGSGEYHSSSEDGTRPGIYYIAVAEPNLRTQATQQSTLYHETYPGHHLQGALALELGDKVHPIARYLGNAGYSEGWALYSERLADELDLYSRPLDRMGLLSDQGARAARMVIDTGIHTQGWSRTQAVDYMLNNCGWSRFDIENEINRYISWPGQANAYMLGMLEINRLRTLAQDQLGTQFDLKTFHRRVLENGSVTLPMVEAAVLDWIESTPIKIPATNRSD
jgi:uncharacterized protein (DUF885 family)